MRSRTTAIHGPYEKATVAGTPNVIATPTRMWKNFGATEEMRIAVPATWPPPRLTELQLERLLNIQKMTG